WDTRVVFPLRTGESSRTYVFYAVRPALRGRAVLYAVTHLRWWQPSTRGCYPGLPRVEGCKGTLPLDARQGDAAHKEPLAEEEDHQYRQQDQQRDRHHVMVVGRPVGPAEHVQPNRQHLEVGRP